MQVHILLCVTLRSMPVFCILISRLAKQDLEVCIEGPVNRKAGPWRERTAKFPSRLAAGRRGGRP